MKVIMHDGSVQEFTFEDETGRNALRHTASHILAQAVKRLYPNTKLAIGPAIKEGFYYDFDRDEPFTDADLEKLEAEIPEAMYVAETENFVRDYDNRLRMQGLDLKTYFQYTGMDLDKLREQLRPQAEKQVKLRLALEKIAKKEKIKATKTDLNNEYKRIAEEYQMEVEKVRELIPEDSIAEDMKVKKAMDLVKESAIVK